MLGTFALDRLLFYVGVWVGLALLPDATEPSQVAVKGPVALGLHWRWDAVHYYSIAAGGYRFYYSFPMPGNQPGGLPAFFPLLPLLTRLTATILGGLRAPAARPIWDADPLLLAAGVLVANVAALAAFGLLYRLACEETGDAALAGRAVLYAAIFPLGFYYAVPYSEGLFLGASVGTFLCARRCRWTAAGLCAAVASAARPVGILLLPALAVELTLARRKGVWSLSELARALTGLILAPAGLALYMLYQRAELGDALAFVHAHAAWNHQANFPLVALWRSVGYAIHPSWSGRLSRYARDVMNVLMMLGFMAVLLVSACRWRPSYVVYGLLLFTMILSSAAPDQNTTRSLGRYVMVLFPVFITMARWGRRRAVHRAILLVCIPLFVVLAAFYVRWYFVT